MTTTIDINPASTGYELQTIHDTALDTREPQSCDVPYCRTPATHWSHRRYLDGQPTPWWQQLGNFLCNAHAEVFALRMGLPFRTAADDGERLDLFNGNDPARSITCLDCGQGTILAAGQLTDAMGRCHTCKQQYWSGVEAQWAAHAARARRLRDDRMSGRDITWAGDELASIEPPAPAALAGA